MSFKRKVARSASKGELAAQLKITDAVRGQLERSVSLAVFNHALYHVVTGPLSQAFVNAVQEKMRAVVGEQRVTPEVLFNSATEAARRVLETGVSPTQEAAQNDSTNVAPDGTASSLAGGIGTPNT